MKHRNIQFCSGDSTGKSGVCISVKDYAVKGLRFEYLLNAGNHLCCLFSMGTGAYTKIVIRCGNAQLIEKHLGHIGIVVLAGMQNLFFDLIGEMLLDCP